MMLSLRATVTVVCFALLASTAAASRTRSHPPAKLTHGTSLTLEAVNTTPSTGKKGDKRSSKKKKNDTQVEAASTYKTTVQRGKASWYTGYRYTASGERFYPSSYTAAHRSLPFGTVVRVTRESTGRSVDVKINNRGPFVRGRIIDLTPTAFDMIASRGAGVVPIKLEIVSLPQKRKAAR